MSPEPRTGVLLVNLGTPDAPDAGAVRRYLAQFLMDPRVIDVNVVSRALLVYGAVLPFRPRKSAAQYRTIWTDRGSPLTRPTTSSASVPRRSRWVRRRTWK